MIPKSQRKTASAQSTRNTFEDPEASKMMEFLNGALLVRMNYEDWQELVKTLMGAPKD